MCLQTNTEEVIRLANKDIRRLNRGELIEVIYQLKTNEQNLQKEVRSLRSQLQEYDLKVKNAGTIAEAALSLSGIYETAQNAADIYLEAIEKKYAETESKCEAKLEDAQKQADMLIQSAKDERKRILVQVKAAQNELQRIQSIIKLQKSQKDEKL